MSTLVNPNVPPRPAPPARHGTQAGTLQFGGPLADKYGIDPDTVDVTGVREDELPVDKETVIEKVLEAHEHARKNQALGNRSGAFFSTNLLLNNGQWAKANNIELNRDTVLCGERSALVNSWNQAVDKLDLDKLSDKQQKRKAEAGMKAQLLAMSSSRSFYSPAPCSECQSWLATDRYFGPDTLIGTLKPDGKNSGDYQLQVQSVHDLLPLNEALQPSISQKPVDELPIQLSKRASTVLKQPQSSITSSHLRDLMQSARRAYETNQASPHSGKNTGASVQLSDGRRSTRSRLDWTARWHEPPDLQAAGNAIQSSTQVHALADRLKKLWDALPDVMQHTLKRLAQSPELAKLQAQLEQSIPGLRDARTGKSPRIEGIAYYGDDSRLPGVVNLGKLAQQTWGGPDTLIAVIENDVIQVRTIDDYMREIYISKSSHSKK